MYKKILDFFIIKLPCVVCKKIFCQCIVFKCNCNLSLEDCFESEQHCFNKENDNTET